MKLTIHEVAQVVGAKNDVTVYPDSPLVKAEFDSRLIATGDLFVPLKGARDGQTSSKQPLKMVLQQPCLRKRLQIIPIF